MDYQILLLFLTCLCLYFLKYVFFSSKSKSSKLPPGPQQWPIVGNIFQLSDDPHRSLARLSKIHGPLMTLKLGSFTTVVVSSVDIVKEVFQKHDLAFSSRKIVQVAHAMNHPDDSIVWLPVSPKWRNLRKISAVHIFNKRSLDATESLRQKKLSELFEHVEERRRNGQTVGIANAAFTVSLNLLSNTFFSTDLASHDSLASHEFRDIVWRLLEAAGKPCLADFFPVFGFFDILGARRSGEPDLRNFFAIFDDIIEKRLSADPSAPCKNDVLATLLKISKEEDSNFTVKEIKHLLLDLFVGGTDTTSSTLEWIMTELIRNPERMTKAQAELDEVLGKNGHVKESDIERLPYLQAVVKEALRLHPPGPFLIPHKAEDDVNLCGYMVSKNSQLLVNLWAMGRDPDIWQNPTMFYPERFLECRIDYKGHHFELLPFGTGRRMCPGLPLAYRMLHLMLAKLIYSFDWKLDNGMRGEDVDMTEKFGLTLQKAKPLFVIPLARH